MKQEGFAGLCVCWLISAVDVAGLHAVALSVSQTDQNLPTSADI